ncbi:MAG TPA: secondary thiamine-phosphate synthase enzyme YjbQ [Candidatus Saccharimonadia bacterium]|nr:secondary thiamine-phosphate synthase enzyme YjbQ [Candidatus Saccharimonadia bacterium]
MKLQVESNHKRQIIDLTESVQALIPSAASGAVLVAVQHTTAAVTTADLDPGTDLDLLDFLEQVTPSVRWRHPHNPSHAPDHLLASVIGPSVILPVQEGRLVLGSWQRIILIELDGPRERQLTVQLLAE